jgi:lysyl-tRNA synthetase class 2
MAPRRAPARRVLAPSDLANARARSRQVRVGGRVVYAAPGRLRLADAYAALDVRLPLALPGVEPGHLVIVEGRQHSQTLHATRLVEHRTAPESLADGEFARLCYRGVGTRLLQRARAVNFIRNYFVRQRFVEVDTPLRVPCPGLDAHVEAVVAQGGWLVTSPELHMKRLLVGGMPRIFQLCHCSRTEELGPWHEPEFLLLEWYRAFADYQAVMGDTERLVAAVTRAITGACRIRLPSGRLVDVKSPFRRMTIRQAFARYAREPDAVALAARDENRFYRLLVERVEPALARSSRPVFLCDYPLSQAALARVAPHDPTVAERFELYLGGIELCNGFSELTDPVEQRRRFAQQRARRRRERRPVYPIDERFMAALTEGLPPSAGNALGVDRLVALACGLETIAEVQAFGVARL